MGLPTRPHRRPGILLALFLVLGGLCVAPSPTAAAPQEADPGTTVDSPMREAPELNPVEARRLRFLFWGYAAVWTLLGLYLVSIWFRMGAVQREMRQIRARLDGAGRP